MTPDEQAELRTLAEAVSTGPWRHRVYYGVDQIMCADWPEEIATVVDSADATFIAAANPAVVLALLDEIEAERDRADRAEAKAEGRRQDLIEWGERSRQNITEIKDLLNREHAEEIYEAETRLAKVRELHHPVDNPGYADLCAECDNDWPCATFQAVAP